MATIGILQLSLLVVVMILQLKFVLMGKWQYVRSLNLRKFFNTTLLNNGADIFFVDFLMGHKIDQTRAAYFTAQKNKLKERYMRFVPFLSIESVETKTLESEEYKMLKMENEELRRRISELERMMEEIKAEARGEEDRILAKLLSDEETQKFLIERLKALGLNK
ncbi:MAG: hypothetical protein ACXQT5_02885 [Candidatus Syntropharchaeia archaeon]